MKMSNFNNHMKNDTTRAFQRWKYGTIAMLVLLSCSFTVLHMHQLWAFYDYRTQYNQLTPTHDTYNNAHRNLTELRAQCEQCRQQLATMQTRCTTIIDPAGLFNLCRNIPNIDLYAAQLAHDMITVDFAIPEEQLATLDQMIGELLCGTALVHTIDHASADAPIIAPTVRARIIPHPTLCKKQQKTPGVLL